MMRRHVYNNSDFKEGHQALADEKLNFYNDLQKKEMTIKTQIKKAAMFQD